MTTTKEQTTHTPGPWKYEAGFVLIPDPKGEYVEAEIDEQLLAHGGAELEECKANARLIAAAPELLAALQSLFFAVDHLEHIRPQLNKADAALAKAEGSAQ